MPPELAKAFLERAKNTFPVGRIGTPEEVAEAYIFAMKVSEFQLDCSPDGSLTLNGFSNLVPVLDWTSHHCRWRSGTRLKAGGAMLRRIRLHMSNERMLC